ncbi:hypothetical protein ACFWN2_07130 [Lentzea sp. NPDC058436]|uniref:hypothetical protein n=1 Tax=Lentzea sp. NPDC058436 TaxID=3346499 RepID=UPI003663814E
MDVRSKLVRHGDALCEEVSSFAEELGATSPALATVALTTLGDLADRDTRHARLLPVVLLEALGRPGAPARPAAVVSSLWWSGFERLRYARGPHAVRSAMATMTLLPHRYLESLPGRSRVRATWSEALTRATTSAVDSLLAAFAPQPPVMTRERVLGEHMATFGAACARDTAMAASLAGQDVNRWRQFGLMHGVLQGIAADSADNADDATRACRPAAAGWSAAGSSVAGWSAAGSSAATGIAPPPPLLLAHAFTANPANQDRLARLRKEAATAPNARVALCDLAHSGSAVRSYNQDVGRLRLQVLDLLAGIVAPGPFRTVVEESVDVAAEAALARPRELLGATAGA